MNDVMTNPSTKNGELVHRVQQLRLDSQPSGQMKSGSSGSWLPWLLCAIMAGFWILYGVKIYKNPGTPVSNLATASGSDRVSEPRPAAGNDNTSSTSTGSSSSAPGDIVLALKGNLIPPVQIAVSPIDVGGRIVELCPNKAGQPFQEGVSYTRGEVMARIEDVSYRAQVAEAQASLEAAKMRRAATQMRLVEILPESVRRIEKDQVAEELKEAEAQRLRAEDQLNRLTRIGGSSVSEQEARQARFDYQAAVARVGRLRATLDILNEGPRKERIAAAEADVKAAEAEVLVAEARLKQAQWRLDNCTIRAPIDGVVLTKKAEIGNLVNPMAFSSSTSGGGAVCDMANLADLEVELDVPEKDIRNVRTNQAATIRADAYPNRIYQGRLDRIMPIADDSKSVIKVRVKVLLPKGEVPGSLLKPKMSVVVTLLNKDYTPE